jgi:hypothetical protein
VALLVLGDSVREACIVAVRSWLLTGDLSVYIAAPKYLGTLVLALLHMTTSPAIL